LGDELTVATVIGGVAGVIFIGYFGRDIRREIRRRDPLRIEFSPHTAEDRLLVTVTNRGDKPLELAWAALRSSDGTEPNLTKWDLFGAVVDPVSTSDGYIFPLLRDWVDPGTAWTGLHVFDKAGHHTFEKVPKSLRARLTRPKG
jgi:hypothetical protein